MPEGDVNLNLKYFIRSAMQKKMPWKTLTFFLNDLTPTLEKSREVVEILVKELQKLALKLEKLEIDKETFENPQVDSETINQKISLNSDYDYSDSEFADKYSDNEEESEEHLFHDSPNQDEDFVERDPFEEQEMQNKSFTFIENEKEFEGKENPSIDLPLKNNRGKICKIYSKKSKDIRPGGAQSGEKSLECKYCGKRFKLFSYLEAHEKIHESIPKLEHEIERKHQPRSYVKGQSKTCETCSKSFTTSHYLKNHMKIHTGEKPFKCKYCGKRFNIKQNLKNHERIHTGIKPYECKTCQKCFGLLGNLRSHERIHTGEKQFQCPTCQKSFVRSDACKRHAKVHLKEKL